MIFCISNSHKTQTLKKGTIVQCFDIKTLELSDNKSDRLWAYRLRRRGYNGAIIWWRGKYRMAEIGSDIIRVSKSSPPNVYENQIERKQELPAWAKREK